MEESTGGTLLREETEGGNGGKGEYNGGNLEGNGEKKYLYNGGNYGRKLTGTCREGGIRGSLAGGREEMEGKGPM